MSYLQTIIERFGGFMAREREKHAAEEAARTKIALENCEYFKTAYGDVPRIDPELNDATRDG